MKEFKMPKIFINVIKNQALSSENEIYGWLIGYEKDDIPIVLAIFECKRFEQQTLISAIPDAQEFQKISSVMPQGIGPIGIYHSHPFSSEVFHSHTDDNTLISLSNQFPNCVSIVTNGKEINYYQMGKKSKAHKIKVNFIEPEVPRVLLVSFEEKLKIKLQKSSRQNAKIKIINKLRNYFEIEWEHVEFYFNDLLVSNETIISNYLIEDLSGDSIQIKLQNDIKQRELIIDKKENAIEEIDCLTLHLKIKVPIYVPEENKKLFALKQTIKTEILGNNILHKIYDGVIDYDNQVIVTPEDVYLDLFGFYIKVSSFKDKSFNTKELSEKNFQFISKTISMLDSLEQVRGSKAIKSKIQVLRNDIESFSKRFDWKELKNKNTINNNIN